MIGMKASAATLLGLGCAGFVFDRLGLAPQRAQRDETVQIPAAAVLAAELAKNPVAFFLAAHHVALHVAAGFAGDNQLRVFDVFLNHEQIHFQPKLCRCDLKRAHYTGNALGLQEKKLARNSINFYIRPHF